MAATDTVPNLDTTSKDVTSEDTASRDAISEDTTSKDATSKDATSKDVTSIMLNVINPITKCILQHNLTFTVIIDGKTNKFTTPQFSLGGWNWYIKLEMDPKTKTYGIFWVLADDVKHSNIKAQRINVECKRWSVSIYNSSKIMTHNDYLISCEKIDWGFPGIITFPYSQNYPTEFTFSTTLTITDSYNLKDAYENGYLSIKPMDNAKYNALVEKIHLYKKTDFDENSPVETIFEHFDKIKEVEKEKEVFLDDYKNKYDQLDKLHTQIRESYLYNMKYKGCNLQESEEMKKLAAYNYKDLDTLNEYISDITEQIIILNVLSFGPIEATRSTTQNVIYKTYLSKMDELFDEYTKYNNQLKPLLVFSEIVTIYSDQIESLALDCKKKIKTICDSAISLTDSIIMYKMEKCSKYDVMLTTTIELPSDIPRLVIKQSELICSLTKKRFFEPVKASDGFTYEKSAIKKWIEDNDVSPTTGKPLANKETFRDFNTEKLLQICY